MPAWRKGFPAELPPNIVLHSQPIDLPRQLFFPVAKAGQGTDYHERIGAVGSVTTFVAVNVNMTQPRRGHLWLFPFLQLQFRSPPLDKGVNSISWIRTRQAAIDTRTLPALYTYGMSDNNIL